MSLFEFTGGALALDRYPPDAVTEGLQAWDAADEYLLEQSLSLDDIAGPTLIFNDNFGALACALHARSPVSISDSWLSQLATGHNYEVNQLDISSVTLQDSLAPLPDAPGLVLMKVPKTLSLLEHQLHALRQVVSPQTRIIAAGKVRDIHTSTLTRFSDILGPTHTSLARKKARLIFCQPAVASVQKPASPLLSWPLEGTDYQIHNYANVFSRTSLDIGARFFLQHLPQALEGTLVDLGSGNGVLGLMALQSNPQAQVHFVDESYMAMASSRHTIEANRPEDMERCQFNVGNGLAGYPAQSLQAVLCNPPFHQQQAVTDHIAWQMFREAKRSLVPGGELRIVANRHLDYYQKLKRLFGNCTTLGTNQKFVVLKSVNTRTGR